MTAAEKTNPNNKPRTAITPTRDENYPEWYQQVVKAADMAENSPVRGCMIIKPWGYALWDRVRLVMDAMFAKHGVENAYFPLLIPLSYMEREAEHVEGFAKECAVVTHHRLEGDGKGGLKAAGELTEPYIIRPTSEMIIGEAMGKWIQSYRDLPLKLNQWANVMRWEMRPRVFLRTAEFLWQEGHTAHANADCAMETTTTMLDVYAKFCEDYLAMPVIKGVKIAAERFPGAEETFTIEAMMQDKKALQAGTSHFLGQNFAKALDISFLNEEGKQVHAYTTSWGVSTRLIGGLIMMHADDDGMVMPPRIAPQQIAIIPIIRDEATHDQIMNYCETLRQELTDVTYHGEKLRAVIDQKQTKPSDKLWGWIKKGVPIRLEIGMREVEEGKVFMARRDKGAKDKAAIPMAEFVQSAPKILDEIHNAIWQKAKTFLDANIFEVDSKEKLYEFFNRSEDSSDHGGFVLTHLADDEGILDQLKKDLAITVRCIPLEGAGGEGACIMTGQKVKTRCIVARSY